jgi:hypothetical protein
MKAHKALREDLALATEVGKKRFPAAEAEIIAELIRRDLPYYDPTISAEKVTSMNRFAQDIGLLSAPVPYEQVVATRFSHIWNEPV